MTAATDSKPPPGVLNQLVRTLSGNNNVTNPPSSAAALESPLPVTAESEEPESERIGSTTPSTGAQTPKQKLFAVERFKNFGHFKKPKPPQPSAVDGEEGEIGTASDPLPTSPAAESSDNHLAAVTEESGNNLNTDELQELPDPADLAQRIQALIDSLPTPDPKAPRTNPKPIPPPARGPDGRPIPPPGSTPIKDPKLIALLQNASYMNGSADEGRQSVWSILDDLGALTHGEAEGDDGDGEDGGGGGSSGSGDISLMIYAPLIPTKKSKVEVARSFMVTIEPPAELAMETALWKIRWPWAGKKEKPEVPPAPPTDPDGQGNAGKGKGKDLPIERRVWVPSTTKISLQAMWWGYRIYLPPPVLAVLSDSELEAIKRAAIITTALQWLFSHIPIEIIPLPLQPAVIILQRIVPYLGYIGSFIAWTWSTIKSYDKGNGVVLTATWLLPIALLPSTLNPPEVPTPPTPAPAPTPAPSTPNTPSAPGAPSAPSPSTPSVPPAPSPPSAPSIPAKQPVPDPGQDGKVPVNTGGNVPPDTGGTISVTPNPGDLEPTDTKAKEKGKGRFWRLGNFASKT